MHTQAARYQMVIMFVLAGAQCLRIMGRTHDSPLCPLLDQTKCLMSKRCCTPSSAATSCVGATLTILLATASILDAEHRLRPERLVKQTRGQRLEQRIQEFIYAVSARWTNLLCAEQVAKSRQDGAVQQRGGQRRRPASGAPQPGPHLAC